MTAYPKPQKRVKASQAEWDRLREEKLDGCRICGTSHGLQLHHIVPRSQGGGDVAPNLVCVCWVCHTHIENREQQSRLELGLRLTDAELAYAVNAKGVDWVAEHYRVGFQVEGYPVRGEAA